MSGQGGVKGQHQLDFFLWLYFHQFSSWMHNYLINVIKQSQIFPNDDSRGLQGFSWVEVFFTPHQLHNVDILPFWSYEKLGEKQTKYHKPVDCSSARAIGPLPSAEVASFVNMNEQKTNKQTNLQY